MRVSPASACLLTAVLCGLLPGCAGDDSRSGADAACAGVENAVNGLASVPAIVNYGFYTDFNPLSYASTQDPENPDFNRPLGYEPALVEAARRLSNDRLQFTPIGIGNPFAGIWLKSATDGRFDMVGGGITALEERRFSAADPGAPLVTFGIGHVQFRQSLLVRSDSAIASHDDLDGSTVVGALKGTTGESRLLQLAGITDDEGYLPANTVITLGGNATLVTGAGDYRIASTGASPGLEERTRLQAPGEDVPLVVYLPSGEAQVQAVTNGDVDAVARGEIGNLVAAGASGGALKVTAVDTGNTEYGAFSYPSSAAGDNLRATMDGLLSCLTDNGNIGFPQWHEDPGIFTARAVRNAP